MGREVTSEEKLLKLIRKKTETSEIAEESISKKKTASHRRHDKQFGIDILKKANHVLLFACFCLIVFLLVNYFFYGQNSTEFAAKGSKGEGQVVTKDIEKDLELPGENPFEYYEEALVKRNIFELPWEDKSAGKTEVLGDSAQLSKRLQIVGVILDDEPKVAIVDLKDKITYFLSKGESIAGAKIEEIEEGKVTVVFNDEKIVLTP